MEKQRISVDSSFLEQEAEDFKKVLIIYTGGTFGMLYNEQTEKLEISSAGSLEGIMKSIPEFYDKK